MSSPGDIVWYTPDSINVYPVFILDFEDNMMFRGIALNEDFTPLSYRWANMFKIGITKARGRKPMPIVSDMHYLLYFKNFLKIEDWE
jgi:hypothetical protein